MSTPYVWRHFPGGFIHLADATNNSFALWAVFSTFVFIICFAVQMLASMMRLESLEV
jgi:hypothetical protein